VKRGVGEEHKNREEAKQKSDRKSHNKEYMTAELREKRKETPGERFARKIGQQ